MVEDHSRRDRSSLFRLLYDEATESSRIGERLGFCGISSSREVILPCQGALGVAGRIASTSIGYGEPHDVPLREVVGLHCDEVSVLFSSSCLTILPDS